MKKISDKKLKKLGGKVPFSSIRKKPRKPLRKVNPKAKAKRKIAYRKMLAGKEYQSARKEALVRSGNRCEGMAGNFPDTTIRCEGTESLHAHHLRYPKSRPLAASDLQIFCPWHHWAAERAKMHKTRMF